VKLISRPAPKAIGYAISDPAERYSRRSDVKPLILYLLSVASAKKAKSVPTRSGIRPFCLLFISSENRQDLQDFSGFKSMRKILRNLVNPVYFRCFRMARFRNAAIQQSSLAAYSGGTIEVGTKCDF